MINDFPRKKSLLSNIRTNKGNIKKKKCKTDRQYRGQKKPIKIYIKENNIYSTQT